MRVRMSLLNVVAVGCLLAAPALQGCSKDPGTNNDAGGTTTDAGNADSGPRTDGGRDAGTGTPIGTNCINNNTGTLEQSTCANTLVCLPLSQENTSLAVCTKDCTADADCGGTNVCWSGICWEGCTAGGTATCKQSAFNCQPFRSATEGFCIPDCSQEAASFCTEFFGYPFNICDSTAGSANLGSCGPAGAACGPTMACTGAHEECYAIPSRTGPSTSSVCVNDCSTATSTTCSANTDCESDSCVAGHCAACPGGYTCDSTRTCQVVPVPNYGPCTFSGQCPTSTVCITFAPGEGLCLPPCTTDAQCTGVGNTPGKCALDLTNGSKVCALDCSAAGAVCPADEACAQIQGLGSFCFPQPGANPVTDGGTTDAGTDAGVVVDAGTDAGTVVDAGDVDAGTVDTDAGDVDAGL